MNTPVKHAESRAEMILRICKREREREGERERGGGWGRGTPLKTQKVGVRRVKTHKV